MEVYAVPDESQNDEFSPAEQIPLMVSWKLVDTNSERIKI